MWYNKVQIVGKRTGVIVSTLVLNVYDINNVISEIVELLFVLLYGYVYGSLDLVLDLCTSNVVLVLGARIHNNLQIM